MIQITDLGFWDITRFSDILLDMETAYRWIQICEMLQYVVRFAKLERDVV